MWLSGCVREGTGVGWRCFFRVRSLWLVESLLPVVLQATFFVFQAASARARIITAR